VQILLVIQLLKDCWRNCFPSFSEIDQTTKQCLYSTRITHLFFLATEQHYNDEFVATEKDMESSEAMWALYVRWCEYFKEKRDHDEMVRLFPNFQKTVRRVHEVKNSNLPYRLEISEYADMKALEHTKRLTDEDFERYKAQGLLDESHLE